MVSFKQLEALFWIVELGGFEPAATKLNMSQSAISKRIAELESTFDIQVFDRSKRNARLTTKGLQLFEHASLVLKQRDILISQVSSKSVLVTHIRLGVTELVGMTWLPSWIRQIHAVYPRLKIEPTLDTSQALFHKLEQEELDVAIVPDVFGTHRFGQVGLASIRNEWMCAPHLLADRHNIDLASLTEHTLLGQSTSSAAGTFLEGWLSGQGIHFKQVLRANNLLGQVSLAMSGLGIAYLPSENLTHVVKRGELQVIPSTTRLPNIDYTALYRADRDNAVHSDICNIAADCCNFTRLLVV
ncbi:LysR family transcriptional regulator [Pseudomonas sp. NPDC012596]|uniref:LysR family transcriptional regulator n=1 Tax=Pseudomonas sp. NPDC012596 TaxID=3364419 RepID=UPI0036791EAE